MTAIILSAMMMVGCASTESAGADAKRSHAEWEVTQGGVMAESSESVSANAALCRVSAGVGESRLSIHVLNSQQLVAYSFRDGSIYVSRALVARLNNDELAASVAHEMGHMLHDRVIAAPAALRGDAIGSGDIERIADVLGRELLLEHHVPVSALPSALRKVADACRQTPYYQPLINRISYLRRLDMPEAP